ncbi:MULTISPECIES: ornithine cyclodeaminase family protein [Anaeromyxobacter]|uniref:ornithine cyclodeaminase family protein n=1 Tax=Anaeromyxobacter TaxID=161492 RepID=UPI001F57FF73|nr:MULTISPECIES: ornithine cyclodeaminase family protein [unclassified Anaeromyxobacter]
MDPHEVLILSQQDVTALLPMQECIEVMAEALGALSRGEAHVPVRSMLAFPDGRGLLAVMPGLHHAAGAFGLKVVAVMQENEGTAFDSHQGAVLLFEARHGSLRAILDGSAVTAIRTAAVSAVATRVLARPDAGDLALLGSGVQASSHLEAMKLVRRLRRVRVWSRDVEHARRFATREGARHGLAIEPVPDAREAVAGADLVCTVTSSRTPVLAGAWLSPGVHVNAVGTALPTARELDTEAVRRARLFVDRRESAQHEAGEYLIPLAERAITPDHLRGELGDVLLGRVPGRTSAGEITVFKSLGLAIEDLAAAEHVNARARATGRGVRVELGGLRVTADARGPA